MAEIKENHLESIGTVLDYYTRELEEDLDEDDHDPYDIEDLIFLVRTSEYYLRQAIETNYTDVERGEEPIDILLIRVLHRISNVKTRFKITNYTKKVLDFYEKEINTLKFVRKDKDKNKKTVVRMSSDDSGIDRSRETSAEPEQLKTPQSKK